MTTYTPQIVVKVIICIAPVHHDGVVLRIGFIEEEKDHVHSSRRRRVAFWQDDLCPYPSGHIVHPAEYKELQKKEEKEAN